jgi:molybdopterin/thiamine biosynthesis adenylyltransferase
MQQRQSVPGAAAPPQRAPTSAALYARNWAFLDAAAQARLAETPLFTAGTGLGSVIACLAARTGFQRFLLADGDVVEESNLNRQAFFQSQAGQNKATATASLIAGIAPDARIQVVPRYVSTPDFADLMRQSGIVVNTIDLDNPAFLSLNRAARAAGVPALFPVNLGWGGAVSVFTPTSQSLDDFLDIAFGVSLDGTKTNEVATRLIERILQRLPAPLPRYLAEMLPRYLARDAQSWPTDPQVGVAANITAALAVRAAVSLATGQPVRSAPDVIWCDALDLISA